MCVCMFVVVFVSLHCMSCWLTIFITGFRSSILAGQTANGLPLGSTVRSQPHTRTHVCLALIFALPLSSRSAQHDPNWPVLTWLGYLCST